MASKLKASALEVMSTLAVPQPDWSPVIKARLSYGRTMTVRMALEAQQVADAFGAPATRKQRQPISRSVPLLGYLLNQDFLQGTQDMDCCKA